MRRRSGPTKKKGELEPREAASPEASAQPRAGRDGRGRRQARSERAGGRAGLRVDDLMKVPTACREADTVGDCARIMRERNIGFVPICNEAGEPVGTITDRDLAIRVLAARRSADTNVQEVMTKEVITCRRGDDLSRAERLMREYRKSRIMVCDEGGKLVGVISLSDIAEAESEAVAGTTLRDVAAREVQHPHAS